ncbi:hypothetical protein Zmor_005318 [Zophobas morio]|uniref:Uncharacterized protein n=1 Tax=Zophobas morio TaxID=2755281 RepID=A0AA38MKJ4_9CUCU|nr:hypothetical protein Zmor_005318 [Zophobas morio]
MNSLTLCVVALATISNCLQLPSGFKKCDRRRTDFNQCLSKAIHGAIISLEKPLKSHDLPSLYDVVFPPDLFVELGNSTYGLKQQFKNLRFTGLSNPRDVAARMDFGPVTHTLTIEATYSKFKWSAEWKAEGTVVLLPLNVVTPVEVIFVEPVFTLKFDLQEHETGGTYFRVVGTGIEIQTRGLKFDFKKPFSSERLNREFNSAMTEKWAEIFAQVQHMAQIYSPFFGTMFNGFLEKVPVAELFEG